MGMTPVRGNQHALARADYADLSGLGHPSEAALDDAR